MSYSLWIPLALALYVLAATVAKHLNDHPERWWLIPVLCVLHGMPLWPVVARWSRALAFDAMLFDLLVLVAFYVALFSAGAMASFSGWQYVGAALVLVGLVMVKAG